MLNISLHEPEVDSQGVEIQTKEHQGRNNKHHNPDDSHRDVRRGFVRLLEADGRNDVISLRLRFLVLGNKDADFFSRG